MIRREIIGPQSQYERSGADGYRDVRPATARLSDALRTSVSGLILCGMATTTWFYPASLNLTLPISVLYATWVLTRRVVLPLRLPKSANRKDWNYPDPRDTQTAEGRRPLPRRLRRSNWAGAVADQRRHAPACVHSGNDRSR